MIKRVLFPVLILAMVLAGVTAPAGAGPTGAAGKEAARATSDQKVSAMKTGINVDDKAFEFLHGGSSPWKACNDHSLMKEPK